MGKLKLYFSTCFFTCFLMHGLLKGDLMTSLLSDVITFSVPVFLILYLFGMLVFYMAVVFIYVSQMLLIW